MWREIQRQVLALSAMWACCGDTSPDDDDAFLLLCADAPIAPVLLAGLTDVDELMVVLGCRFALDVFTVAQQDYAPAHQDSLNCGSGPTFWR